jgi:hypothetical protein
VLKKLINIPVIGPVLFKIRRFVHDPAGMVAAWRDYFKTRRDAAFIRREIRTRQHGPMALILCMDDDSIYMLKIFAMLAVGLKLEGWRITVLLKDRARSQGRRYFRAFGIDHFVYFGDFSLSAEERRLCADQARSFMTDASSFRTVKNWRFRDSWIGPQILSTVSRHRLEGTPDVTDPKVRGEISSLLPLIFETINKAGKVVDAAEPQLALTIEANYANFGPLVDVLITSGINVVQIVQPWRDDTLTFKRLTRETRRQHPSSVSSRTFHEFIKRPWTTAHDQQLEQILADRYSGRWFLQARNQPGTAQKNRNEILAKLQFDPAKKTAVIFSHILWDANLFYGDDLFGDYGDWLVQTVRAACQNSEVNWLIKLHPANVWKRARERFEGEYAEVSLIHREIGALPAHVRLLPAETDISTFSIFQIADYGITVRGTTGMELPCFGVTTFTAGTGRYSGLGFTVDSQSKEEYLGRLSRIHNFPSMDHEAVVLARKHAYAAFHLRLWPIKSFQSVFDYKPRGSHPLDHNLLFKVHSLEDILHNGDLKSWAVWAQDEKQVDFMIEDEIMPDRTVDLISANDTQNN